MKIDERFVFSGHAIGASAHFHKLDDLLNLDHAIPTLGSSVLPQVGGLSHHRVNNYSYSVKEPRRRTLLSAQHSEAIVRGRQLADHYETEVEVQVRGVSVLEKLHVDLVEMKQKATRGKGEKTSLIRTSGAKLEGMHLGSVAVHVELDCDPFEKCCSKQEMLDFLSQRDDDYRKQNGWRFDQIKGRIYCTLVKKIELDGPPEELANIKVDENLITWDGFGKIYLGEIIIGDDDREFSMIRLKMGSDGGGEGVIGGGKNNGGTVP